MSSPPVGEGGAAPGPSPAPPKAPDVPSGGSVGAHPLEVMRHPLAAFGDFDRRVYLIGVASFVRSSGRSASWLFLPLLLYAGYGLSYFEIGLLTAAIVPVAIAANWLGGALADRWGRRWISTAPSFLATATFVVLYLDWHSGLPGLMLLWGLISLAMNFQGPAQNAVIGDVTRPEQVVRGFSFQRVLSNAGFALSPAVGGLLAADYGLSVIFLMAAVASLGEGLLLLLFLRESRPSSSGTPAAYGPTPPKTRGEWRKRMTEPFGDRALVLFGVMGFLLTLATQQFGTGLSLFLRGSQGLPYSEIGLVYSLNGVLVVLLQLPISLLLRSRPLGWLAVGSLFYGAAFLIFDFAPGFMVDLGAMTVLTMGEDVVSPLQNSVVSGMGGSRRRGGYFGVYNVFTQSARAVAPPVGTLLLAAGGNALWGFASAMTLLVATGYLWLERSTIAGRSGPTPPPSPSPDAPLQSARAGPTPTE